MSRPTPDLSGAATEEDVYSCFRIFLNREPTAEDWAIWRPAIAAKRVKLTSLADYFIRSSEFLGRDRQDQPELVELERFKIFVRLSDELIGAVIWRELSYERHVAKEMVRTLRPGMVFVDIGANIGYFSLLAASVVGKLGKVIAFEPVAENCELLSRSRIENGFTNIELHSVAVGNRDQVVALAGGVASSNWMIGSFDSQVYVEEPLARTVRSVALDECLCDVDRIDVIKMDVEGAEPLAWQGMQSLLREHRPVVFTELSPTLLEKVSGASPDDFLDSIYGCGYRIKILGFDEEQEAAYADKTEVLELASAQLDKGFTHLDLVAYP